MTKRIFLVCLALVCLVLTGCGGKAGLCGQQPQPRGKQRGTACAAFSGHTGGRASTSMGDILIVLFPQYAPMAMENFEGLAQQGVLQRKHLSSGRCRFCDSNRRCDAIRHRRGQHLNNNAYPNELSDKLHHYSGAVALARAADGSVGNLSQFYIVQTPEDSVDKTAAEEMVASGVRQR